MAFLDDNGLVTLVNEIKAYVGNSSGSGSVNSRILLPSVTINVSDWDATNKQVYINSEYIFENSIIDVYYDDESFEVISNCNFDISQGMGYLLIKADVIPTTAITIEHIVIDNNDFTSNRIKFPSITIDTSDWNENNQAYINSSDITTNSIVDLYYTKSSFDVVRNCSISAEVENGYILLTAGTKPEVAISIECIVLDNHAIIGTAPTVSSSL